MAELPTGTVTFLFTDLEGSTRLWEQHPDVMRRAVTRHDEILHDAVGSNRGVVFSTMGDGIAAAFTTAPDALAAALEAQRRLRSEPWGEIGPLRARMGVHSAEASLRASGQYANRPLNRCARLMAVAHGGQLLVSDATASLARGELPDDARLADLGEHRLRDLQEPIRIFQLEHPDLVETFPPLRSLDGFPGNLPRQLTTFVGRERELDALVELLRSRPLVTLTGVGGVGKTRLAVQAAAEVLPEFSDGAWLCQLAPVADPDALWEAVATELGVQPSPGRAIDETVIGSLAPRRMLLVLDNCEHVIDAAARLVNAIVRGCPQVVVLATSREGLALAGEQIVAVPSLDLPPADADVAAIANTAAVQLFVDRAKDAKSDFELNEQNAPALTQVCRRLDGMPLAIELAAARMRSLTVDEVASRLDQRFRLLTRGSRAALERHQTLRHTIDWSYDLLTSAEQAALNQISVFAGGCDLAAAEAVLAGDELDEEDAVDLLTSLVEKSLVLLDDPEGTGARYRLLETIRQYAQERLEATNDAPAARRRHAEWYVALAEAAGPRLRSRIQIEAAAGLAPEIDNFRASVDWAAETESHDYALRLVSPLTVSATTIGYAAMDWAQTAIAIPGAEDDPRFPIAAAWASWGRVMQGDLEGGRSLLARAHTAEARLGTTELLVCQAAGTLAFFSGDVDSGLQHAVEWVRRARSIGDAYELAHALILLAALQFSDLDASMRHTEEALLIARKEGIASATSTGLAMLASQLMMQDAVGDERVMRALEEAREAATQIGDIHALSLVESVRGWLAIERGDPVTALETATAEIEQSLARGDVAVITRPYGLAVMALTELDEAEPAAIILGARRAKPMTNVPPRYRERLDVAAGVLSAQLGAERLADLEARGLAMTHAEIVVHLRATADRVLCTSARTRASGSAADSPGADAREGTNGSGGDGT